MKPDFKAFADGMLSIASEGCDADGADIQSCALKYGLLRSETKTEACGENCACADVGDFPLECYVKTYKLGDKE